jgi:hypothetical protein
MYTYIKNGKTRPVETILRMGGGGDKGEWRKGWILLRYSVNTFVKDTMYPQYNNMIKKYEK